MRQACGRLLGLGYEITIASTQRLLVEGCKNIVIETSPIPVHEHLPGVDNQKPVYKMDYDEVQQIVDLFMGRLTQEKGKFDLLHAHHANLTAIVGQQLAVDFDIPVVNTVHGTGLERLEKFDNRVAEAIVQSIMATDRVIVTTQFMKGMFESKIPDYPSEKIAVIPCGVDTTLFYPDKEVSSAFSSKEIETYGLDKPFVLYAGAMIHAKGPDHLVKAMSIYHSHISTILIGGGDLLDEIRGQVQDEGLNANVLGFVTHEQKNWLFNHAYLAALPIIKDEHFGIVFIESLAAGAPVVTYSGGSTHELITTDVGIIVPKGDSSSLGESIKALVDDRVSRDEMSKNAREAAVQLFDYDSVVLPMFTNLYAAILKEY